MLSQIEGLKKTLKGYQEEVVAAKEEYLSTNMLLIKEKIQFTENAQKEFTVVLDLLLEN